MGKIVKNYKICFWLNTKSNHQNSFLKELFNHSDIDLEVRYISKPSQNRIEIGWNNTNLESYEKYVSTFKEAINSLCDYKERIHIMMGNNVTFSSELINHFINSKIQWIHWNERFGIVLAKKLNFNMKLFNLLRPFYLLTKFKYGYQVNKYALGAFSQGYLAKKDFEYIGIKKNKIEDLFYTTELKIIEEIKIEKNIQKEINFLYVGELSTRKGIEELLNACSVLNESNWILTLVGADKSNGFYERLAKKLNIENKIKFIGVVPNNQLDKYYRNANVFIFPSKFDGWGAVLNEAIFYCLPIISTNETSASFSLIKNNGFIVNAGDTNVLANCMLKYITNKDLILTHSKKSKELSKICTAEENVKRFINALNNWTNNDI